MNKTLVLETGTQWKIQSGAIHPKILIGHSAQRVYAYSSLGILSSIRKQHVLPLAHQQLESRYEYPEEKDWKQISMDVFKVWFDHGKSPDSASYQYIVVPGVSEQELMETSGNNRGIKIIANTSEVHAVNNNKLGIAQMAFYKAGEVKVSDYLTVRMDSPGMAMLKIRDDKAYELTVSDPTRKLSRVMVTLSGKYNVEGDHQISLADTKEGSTLIILDLPTGVYAGKSISVGLN